MTPQPPHPPHELGRRGESLAAGYLLGRGWEILATNYRFGRREVDLVVHRHGVLAFVEVKTRAGAGYGAPEEAVTRLKQREIEIVAREYLVRHSPGDLDVRFDVLSIVVRPDGRVEQVTHLEDAWRPGASR
jgi:putative endonuclease